MFVACFLKNATKLRWHTTQWISMTRKPPIHAARRWWRDKKPVCLTNQLPLDLTSHLFYINQNSKWSGPIVAAYIFIPKFYLVRSQVKYSRQVNSRFLRHQLYSNQNCVAGRTFFFVSSSPHRVTRRLTWHTNPALCQRKVYIELFIRKHSAL